MTTSSSPRPRGRPTQQRRSAEKQQAMRAAAAQLLIDRGPDAVTHRQVAAAAGLPQGSASYYFPNAEGLFLAAVEEAEKVRVAGAHAYADALRRRTRSPATTARLLIEALYAPHLEPDVVPLRLAPMLEATRTPSTAAAMADAWPHLLAALRKVLDASGYSAIADDDIVQLRLLADAALLYATTAGSDDAIDYAVERLARLITQLS
ncbi:TetR/AcrR family transcriptional regulator [Nocardioides sp. Bht2]|uniref:TetR/AcrR family transcriptional regulator n=1 Tax=Nocardioides sp. Bht2 TaxID=3392297 RepID=UPI0039B58882